MILNMETAPTKSNVGAPFETLPTGPVLGAEVRVGDLRALDNANFVHVLEAWRQHSVVLFRDQALSDHDLIVFSRRFGDLDWAPIQGTAAASSKACQKSTSSPTSR